jgi:hypothetical protein
MKRLATGIRVGAVLTHGNRRGQSQHRDQGRARSRCPASAGEGAGDHRLSQQERRVQSRSRNLKDVKGIGAKRFEKIKGDLDGRRRVGQGGGKAGDGPLTQPDASSPQRMAKGAVSPGKGAPRASPDRFDP